MSEMDQRLGSRYVLKERLGRGAMGTVWRARNTDTGTDVAVKVLSEELSDEPEMLTRFIHERNTLVAVNHPNLVRIHDLVVEDGRLAIVMDLVKGPDLHRHLTEHGVLGLPESALIGRGVAEALTAIHTAGIIHRDLKPANILLDLGGAEPQPKLVDFGIARMLAGSRLTARSSVVGTPQYLSPEAISGAEPSPALDVYALGIALYELLTGKPPFSGELLQVLNQHLYQEPPWPQQLPPQIVPLLQAMLAKNPALRPTAATVAQAMDALLEGTPVELPAPPAVLPQQGPYGPMPVPYPAGSSGASSPVPPAQPQQQPLMPYGQFPADPTASPTPGGYGPPQGPATPTPVPGIPGVPGAYGTPPGAPVPSPSPSGFFYPSPAMFEPGTVASGFTPSPPPFTNDMFTAKKPKRDNKKLALWGGGTAAVVAAAVVSALLLTGGGSPSPTAGPTPGGATRSAAAAAGKPCPPETAVGVPASARWTLAGDAADCSLAPSDTDEFTLAGGAGWTSSTRGEVLLVNGSSAVATVRNNSIVDTANSFTVSIWVELDKFGASDYSTVLAIRSGSEDAFDIEYNPGWGAWAFNHTTAQGPNAQWVAAAGKTAPQTYTWTHLVGVYDASAHTMTLYQDGHAVVSRTGMTGWNGNAEIVLGANVDTAGTPFAGMTGKLSDLQIFDSALTAGQVASIQ